MTSLGCFFVRTSATTFVGENSNIDPWPYITFGEREFYPTELLVDLLEAVRVIPAQPTEKKADSPV